MDRSERRRRTARIVARRKKVMRLSDGMLEWADDRYIGRCKTLHPFDCGRPRCGVCSLNKRRWSGITMEEKKAEMTLKEGTAEIAGPTNPHRFVGYMCGTDFFYEQGEPIEGNLIFATIDALKSEHSCWKDECGIVEVAVEFKKWVEPPSGPTATCIDGEQLPDCVEATVRLAQDVVRSAEQKNDGRS